MYYRTMHTAGVFLATTALFTLFIPSASADVLTPGQDTVLSPGETVAISAPAEISPVNGSVPDNRVFSAYAAGEDEIAPECINAYKEKGAIQVENKCGYDLRIKVIVAFSLDTECKMVVDGTRTNIGFRPLPDQRIDKVVLC